MAKDPAMLWYWSDWHSGTITLSRFLKGCYMDVLHAQFNSGRLTLEEIRTVLGSDFGQAWPALQKKFAVDDTGKYFNERLELEKSKRQNFTASRRKNLESHKDSHMNSHTGSRMENVNRDRNVFGNGGGVGEPDSRGTDERVVVQLTADALDLVDGICDYFAVKKITTSIMYNSVCEYVSTLMHRNELQIGSIALQKYVAYKKQSGEQRHNVNSWIGSMEARFQDGQWVMVDWESKLKTLQLNGNAKRSIGAASPEPGKDYTEGF